MAVNLNLDLIPVSGKFADNLKRNNKEIKRDRAEEISRKARSRYERKIEDLKENIINMLSEQENLLDLSPADSHTLKLATDFDSEIFVDTDIKLAVKIRQEKIRLEEAVDRYNYLFEVEDSTSEETA